MKDLASQVVVFTQKNELKNKEVGAEQRSCVRRDEVDPSLCKEIPPKSVQPEQPESKPSWQRCCWRWGGGANGYQPKGQGHREGSEEQRTRPGGEIQEGFLVYKLTGEASSGDRQHKSSEAGRHRISLEGRGLMFWA